MFSSPWMSVAFVLLKPDTLNNMCFFFFSTLISWRSWHRRPSLCSTFPVFLFGAGAVVAFCLRRQNLSMTQREHKRASKRSADLGRPCHGTSGLPGLLQSHHLHLPTHFLEGLQLPPFARPLLFLKVCEPDIKTGFYISLNATILPGWAPGTINHLWEGANMLAYKRCAEREMNNMRPDQVTSSQNAVRVNCLSLQIFY